MWPFSHQKKAGAEVVFAIDGLHCSSCVLNIDGSLEDLDGVVSSSTNYAKAITKVEFDPTVVSVTKLKETIKSLGYDASEGPTLSGKFS